MSKEFAVDGALGDSTAVDGYILLVLAWAVFKDNLWEVFLTCSALTDDEHREVDLRHSQRPLDSGTQCWCLSYNGEALLHLLYECTDIIFFSHYLVEVMLLLS